MGKSHILLGGHIRLLSSLTRRTTGRISEEETGATEDKSIDPGPFVSVFPPTHQLFF
jgi:hypothetical protein